MGPYTLPDTTIVNTYTANVTTPPPTIGQLLIGNGGDVTLNDSSQMLTANSWVVIGWGNGAGGAGTMNLSGTAVLNHNNDGDLHVGEGTTGTLNVSDSATVNSNNGAILVGLNGGTGTMSVSGTATVNNNTSDIRIGDNGIGTLYISDNANINNNQYWTVLGRNGGTGHVIQTGGTFTSTTSTNNADANMHIGEGGSTGDWTMTGGAIVCGGSNFSIGEGGTGTMSITGTSTVHLTRGEFWVGDGSSASGSLTVGTGSDNPTITIDNNWLAVGRNGANGTVIFNSGTITKTGNGDMTLAGWWLNGANGATWTQNGGALNIATDIRCGENGNAVFTLNGGSVKANMIYRMGSGVSEFHFNGGSVELTGAGIRTDGSNLPDNVEDVKFNYVEPGGANIKLNGDVTFPTGFQAGLSGSGGVTKSGPGNMIITGNSTYTGLTHVVGGGLVIGNGAAISSDVTLDSTATLLAGNGIVGDSDAHGVVTVGKGVTVSPGEIGAVGTLYITKSLSLDTAKLNINVDSGVTSTVAIMDPYMGIYGKLSATGTTVVFPTQIGALVVPGHVPINPVR